MAEITAAAVKALRDRTNAPMMDCKRALAAANGDIELAVEELRKSGRAKADKKADRVAAEGVIMIQSANDGQYAVIVEVNSETDFVARDTNFLAFAEAVAKTVLSHKTKDIAHLSTLSLADTNMTVEEARKALIAKVGENINVRRIELVETKGTHIASYLHGSRIGVLAVVEGDSAIARDVAMHIAASKPLVVAPSDVPSDVVAKEKEIYLAQAASSGKPQDILEKMVAGKLKKYLDEISLLGQPFIKDPDVTVEALLAKNHAKVISFVRFEVGEGIQKETEDFVEAVMAQVASR